MLFQFYRINHTHSMAGSTETENKHSKTIQTSWQAKHTIWIIIVSTIFPIARPEGELIDEYLESEMNRQMSMQATPSDQNLTRRTGPFCDACLGKNTIQCHVRSWLCAFKILGRFDTSNTVIWCSGNQELSQTEKSQGTPAYGRRCTCCPKRSTLFGIAKFMQLNGIRAW